MVSSPVSTKLDAGDAIYDLSLMIRLLTWIFERLEGATAVVVKGLVWLPARIQRRRHRRASS
jgi:hypothetical protein